MQKNSKQSRYFPHHPPSLQDPPGLPFRGRGAPGSPSEPVRGLGAPRVWHLRVSAGVNAVVFRILATPGPGSCLGVWGGGGRMEGEGGNPNKPQTTRNALFFVVWQRCPARVGVAGLGAVAAGKGGLKGSQGERFENCPPPFFF